MFKLSYYVFGFENKYCCLFLINKGTLLYDQPSYTPSLWYFQELLFLTDQEVPRKDISNLEPPDDTNHGEVRNNLSRYRTYNM